MSLRKTRDLAVLTFAAGAVFSIAVAQTALTLALFAWALMMLRKEAPVPSRSPYDYIILAYIAVGVVSVLFSAEKGVWMPFLKRLALIPIFYLVRAAGRDRRFLGRIMLVVVSAMSIMALVGIWKYLSGTGRLRLFNHYMTSGGIIMMISLVTLAFAIVPAPRRFRIASFAAGVLMMAPLVMTFTRSSWLGLLAGLLLMCLLQNRKMILAVAAVVVIFLAVAPGAVTERARSAFDPSHPNNLERTYMWKAGIDIIRDHPFTGVGDIDLGAVYERYRPPQSAQSHGHLHNNIIMFGATMGIPGVIVFLALFGTILAVELKIFHSAARDDWLARAVSLGALGAFAGFQVSGLFEWNFGDAEVAMLLWITVGLSLAAADATKASSGCEVCEGGK